MSVTHSPLQRRSELLDNPIETWTYADETARTGATGFSSDEVGKIAYQTDEGTYWRLTAVTPTWAPVTSIHVTQHGEGGIDALVFIDSSEPSTTFPGQLWVDTS